MAVTLFRRRRIINNIRIVNGKNEEENPKQKTYNTYDAKIRGKTYGRRSIN